MAAAPALTAAGTNICSRHWPALGVFSMTGVVFANVVQHEARLEYAPEVIVVIVAVLGLGISCLTFLFLLKR